MNQLLHLQWWLSYFPQAAPWWLFCVVLSIASFPLCLRMFRGLADRGAGLATGTGIIVTTFLAWFLCLEGLGRSPEGTLFRFAVLLLGCALLTGAMLFRARGYVGSGTKGLVVYAPSALCGLIGLVSLPHTGFTVWLAVILLACISVACWINDPSGLYKRLRETAVLFLLSQVIFLVAFMFFVNVRSYLPWATFELSLYQAEKWGNYTHLNSIMGSRTLPPSDIWFNNHPVNYYYGGHLVVATLAKATGTSPEIAFNLGLATIFALTMAMGFSFSFSLIHLVTRRYALGRGVPWHMGLGWGLLGMLAIGTFGNLDPWRQLLTRDMDYGVRIRYERSQREITERWKREHLLPPQTVAGLISSTQGVAEAERPDALLSSLRRVEVQLENFEAELAWLTESAEDIFGRFDATNAGERRQAETAVQNLLSGNRAQQILLNQTGLSQVDFEDSVYTLMAAGDFSAALAQFRRLESAHRSPEPVLAQLREAVESRMSQALNSSSMREMEEMLWDGALEDAIASVASRPPEYLRLRFEQVKGDRSYRGLGTFTGELAAAANAKGQLHGEEARVASTFRNAWRAFAWDPANVLFDFFGRDIPSPRLNPTIADIRFTWQNVGFINFWDSSRAIKGTPPGAREAGTVTEFPYFSAILGDLHPHHMALPFTLAALCACVSLLRKNARRKKTDLVYFRRSWPELCAMAFFIGAVFPVNIWDSIVLSVVYLVVVLVSMRGVHAGESWKWVGLAGFLVLLSFVVGIPFNSIPGNTPLFQNFPFFLLATALLVPGIPLALLYNPHREPWKVGAMLFMVAALVAGAGALFAFGRGGLRPAPVYTMAIRDASFFLVMALVAAYWTLLRPNPTHRWWYAVGGVFAMVGSASLLFVMPFKLYFNSPIFPDGKIFYDFLPPFLSHELKSATGRFWATFWSGSPVNPFPQNLRTDLRDFFYFWGIFFVPILAFSIGRFFRAARHVPQGFPFMMAMLALAAVAFVRNYLGYWAGALSLGLMVTSLYYAMVFRQRAEGPMWALLTAAFFWTWFVEALHFDDDMAGNYERYNTVFKIYYPIWPIFAGAMVVAVREMFGRFHFRELPPLVLLGTPRLWMFIVLGGIGIPYLLKAFFPQFVAMSWFYLFMGSAAVAMLALLSGATSERPGKVSLAVAAESSRLLARWPAALAAAPLLFLGMYYPISATATRTREFFTWPVAGMAESRLPHRAIYTQRTLDATTHLGEYPKYRQDYLAFSWMRGNLPRNATILERAGEEAYTHVGRMSTGSGATTIIGWKHHQHQWRGRGRPAPARLKGWYFENVDTLTDFSEELARIAGRDTAEIGDEDLLVLLGDFPENRDMALQRLYPGTTPDQFRRMVEFVEQYDQLGNLQNAFGTIYADIEGDIPPSVRRSLWLAGKKERLRILHPMFPTAQLMDLYRLELIVERNDLNMNQLMGKMLRDVETMYFEPVMERVIPFYRFYGVEYVVVGELERQFYREKASAQARASWQSLEEKFEAWGFEQLYSSEEDDEGYFAGLSENVGPSIVYRVPEDFLEHDRRRSD